MRTELSDTFHTCSPLNTKQNVEKNYSRKSKLIYDNFWLGEQRNATDYIEYLNRIRRNSMPQIGASFGNNVHFNYYQISITDFSITKENGFLNCNNSINNKNINISSDNYLKVPRIYDEELRKTPDFSDISKKISEINLLDTSVSSLIYKSIEVHAEILVMINIYLTLLILDFEKVVTMRSRQHLWIP